MGIFGKGSQGQHVAKRAGLGTAGARLDWNSTACFNRLIVKGFLLD
jgi:hypothetical protein